MDVVRLKHTMEKEMGESHFQPDRYRIFLST